MKGPEQISRYTCNGCEYHKFYKERTIVVDSYCVHPQFKKGGRKWLQDITPSWCPCLKNSSGSETSNDVRKEEINNEV